ncbi:uncharacterized protein BcabD6B2_49720 [Babesia caballi]|uniref:Membrane protein, putative n=1 Tax=Babesia caballi TaxID=5871 RepID=A0AAV4M0F5_BABCB|nr:membrane protein, putative [Babesia caballi]
MEVYRIISLALLAYHLRPGLNVTGKSISYDMGEYKSLLVEGEVNVKVALLSKGDILKIKCPRNVNEIDLDLFPNERRNSGRGGISVYATVNGVYDSVDIDDILMSGSETKNIKLQYKPNYSSLVVDMNTNPSLLRSDITSFDVHCSSEDYKDTVAEVLPECMLRHPIWRNESFKCPCTGCGRSSAPMLGIVRVKLTNVPRVLQGCGTFAVPLLMGGSESSADGKRSCTVDVMETPDIGFACSGHIEPARCPEQMYDSATDQLMSVPFKVDVTPTEYDGHMLLKMRCFDPSTDKTNAVITIKNQQEYVCDLSARLAEHMEKPIVGDWCDVVLQPESSVTIMFPVDDKESMELETPSGSASNRSLTPTRLSVETLSRVICNNALHYTTVTLESLGLASLVTVDDSLIDIGVVTIKYSVAESANEVTKPTSLYYKYQMDSPIKISDAYSITGTVKVTLNPNVEKKRIYRPSSHLRSGDAASVTSSQSGVSLLSLSTVLESELLPPKVYTYSADLSKKAEIRCTGNERLVPNNCHISAFDHSRHSVISFPEGVSAHPHGSESKSSDITVVDIVTRPFSFSCSCVDQSGIETKRVIYNDTFIQYFMRGRSTDHLSPFIAVPRVEMFSTRGEDLSSFTEISITTPVEFREPIRPAIGDKTVLLCTPPERFASVTPFPATSTSKTFKASPYTTLEGVRSRHQQVLVTEEDDISMSQALWLPLVDQKSVLDVISNGDEHILKPVSLNDLMITRDGFSISNDRKIDDNHIDRSEIVIRYPESAIVLSKRDAEEVTFYHICGSVSPARYDDTSSQATFAQELDEKKQVRSMEVWDIVKVIIPTTDPYVHGCGVPSDTGSLFRPETETIYDTEGKRIGCEVDLNYVRRAGFYCPLPYRTDPPNCRPSRGDYVSNMERLIGRTFGVYRSNNFIIFTQKKFGFLRRLLSKLVDPRHFLCLCVTDMGTVVSTIQIKYN